MNIFKMIKPAEHTFSDEFAEIIERLPSVNYNEIPKEIHLVNSDTVDISVIIPVMGRESFHEPAVRHFQDAIKNCPSKKISLTFVEHSPVKGHYTGKENYIHIPKIAESRFNKCLAFNVGVLYSNKAHYYLLHDLDLLVKPDFFVQLLANEPSKHKALQAFTKMRVQFLDDVMTLKIVEGGSYGKDFVEGDTCLTVGNPGAPGGSWLISREMFLNAGGYDPDLFSGYAIEDRFFLEKVELVGMTRSCDDPAIELFHMYHPTEYHTVLKEQTKYYDTFHGASIEERTAYTKLKRTEFSKYVR